MEQYLDLRSDTVSCVVFEMKSQWGNIHDVPAKSIDAMSARWEEIPKNLVMYEMTYDDMDMKVLKPKEI